MRRLVQWEGAETLPDRDVVLRYQGISKGREVPERIERLYEEGGALYLDAARPHAVVETIGVDRFAKVHEGEGRNSADSPLARIFPRASRLELFAATLGNAICDDIARRFREGDYATAAMLDSFASAGAEKMAALLEEATEGSVAGRNGRGAAAAVTLAYSPGYCGWHVSGQAKLFAALRPAEAGVALKEGSFLMEPLKSVSGVLVTGAPALHRFENDFPFCSECEGKSCLIRMRDIERNLARHEPPGAAGGER